MFRKIVSCALGLLILFGTVGCIPKGPGALSGYDYPTDYDPDRPSWEQIAPGDEDVNIVWFVDSGYSDDNYRDLIYKRTGVKVTFQTALTDDHSEINTMIAGNKLPDVISIDDASLRVMLAEEGYMYPIDWLAKGYAPSMLKNVPQEHWDYYKSTDGHTYAVASNFYQDADIAEFKELGGKQFANGGLVVRKDWLNDYIAYRTAQDPSFNPDTEITKASGFLEMCQWVKQNKGIPNNTPTLALSEFRTTALTGKISQSLTALEEFFGVPLEDANGDLVYVYGTPEFYDVVKYLNELYRDNIVISNNFAYTQSDLIPLFTDGKTFAYVGQDHELRWPIAKRESDGYNKVTDTIPDSNQYVSIVLTNEAGDPPQLMDYAGRGNNTVMISRNCKRPDRVIKVLDYLLSEQGAREMMYGENEGEYYNYDLRPGQINPKTGKPSRYGTIVPTQKFKDVVTNNSFSGQSPVMFGLGRNSPLVNQLYARLTSESLGYSGIFSAQDWVTYKDKSVYSDYTFPRVPFNYPMDVSDRKATNDYMQRQADIEAVWITALPKMMMAGSDTELKQIYDDALALSIAKGANEWLAFANKDFKSYKEKLGIKYAWPKADPAYVSPPVRLYGNTDGIIQRPKWIYGGI